jgi:hypothetical protein
MIDLGLAQSIENLAVQLIAKALGVTVMAGDGTAKLLTG